MSFIILLCVLPVNSAISNSCHLLIIASLYLAEYPDTTKSHSSLGKLKQGNDLFCSDK